MVYLRSKNKTMVTHYKGKQAEYLKSIIIDIETVPLYKHWNDVPLALQKHWIHKMQFMHLDALQLADPGAVYAERAGIYAEFGKIVCIGLGAMQEQDGHTFVRLKSIADQDEAQLLQDFVLLIQHIATQKQRIIFAGHNIKEFDIPYICRRMVVQGIALPQALQLSGMRPWQIPHQDTLELWRFGDYKHYISLDLLAQILDVPSSKSDMDGSQVAYMYWEEQDMDRISRYCLQDVYTTTLVYLKLTGFTGQYPEAHYV
jgi:DNA polymerase elongation subunit (family B)